MPNASQEFSKGMALHQAGKLDEARAIYEAVLLKEPSNEHVLHVLGLVHVSQRRKEEGIALFRRCLELRPDFPEALTNLGSALLDQKQPQEALALHDKSIALNPKLAETHANRGNALRALNRPQEAIEAYGRAIALKPEMAEAYNNLGNVLKSLKRTSDAIASYQAALKIKPSYVEAWYNLGNTLFATNDPAKAEGAYRCALALAPNHPDSHNNLGTSLKAQGKLPEALAEFDRAIALRPGYPEAHAGRGDVFQAQDRLDEAVAAYGQALAFAPLHVEALCNLGNTLTAQNKPAEAITLYRLALATRPELAEVRYNEALAELVQGNLTQGWEGYECRWDHARIRKRRGFAQPQWSGKESLEGKTILLYAEQGLGDTLQFVRYVPLVRERGGRIWLEVQAPLKSLLSDQWEIEGVVAKKETLPDFDLHCPLMSLPRAFGTDLGSIPSRVPYLKAPAAKSEAWRARLGQGKGPRVGLVWSGSAGHQNDRNRSIPFSEFRRIIEGISGTFVSLQKDVRDADRAEFARSEVRDISADLGDFSDTAALVSNLDLVIGVDTSVVHLAGSLGIPTWLLLPFASDWRWLLNRMDSPWYPSIRLFRQPATGAWVPVIEELKKEWAKFSRLPPRG